MNKVYSGGLDDVDDKTSNIEWVYGLDNTNPKGRKGIKSPLKKAINTERGDYLLEFCDYSIYTLTSRLYFDNLNVHYISSFF